MFGVVISVVLAIFISNHIIKNKENIQYNFYLILVVVATIINIGIYNWWFILFTPIIIIAGVYGLLAFFDYRENCGDKTPIIYAVIICLLTSIFALFTSEEKERSLAEYNSYRVKVNFVLEEYHGVGREFEYYATVNGQDLSKSGIVKSNGTAIITCFAKIVERDSYYYPDVAYSTKEFNAWNSNICHIYLNISEYGGQSNAGSYAFFRVTFTFEGIE